MELTKKQPDQEIRRKTDQAIQLFKDRQEHFSLQKTFLKYLNQNVEINSFLELKLCCEFMAKNRANLNQVSQTNKEEDQISEQDQNRASQAIQLLKDRQEQFKIQRKLLQYLNQNIEISSNLEAKLCCPKLNAVQTEHKACQEEKLEDKNLEEIENRNHQVMHMLKLHQERDLAENMLRKTFQFTRELNDSLEDTRYLEIEHKSQDVESRSHQIMQMLKLRQEREKIENMLWHTFQFTRELNERLEDIRYCPIMNKIIDPNDYIHNLQDPRIIQAEMQVEEENSKMQTTSRSKKCSSENSQSNE